MQCPVDKNVLIALYFEVNRTVCSDVQWLSNINVKVLVEWSKPTQMSFLTSHASCPLAPYPSSTPSPSSEEHLSNLVSKQLFPISRARFHKTLTHPFKESVKLFWPHQVTQKQRVMLCFIWIFWFVLLMRRMMIHSHETSVWSAISRWSWKWMRFLLKIFFLFLLYLLFSPSAFV